MPDRYLCVSLHDVAPVRWGSCERVIAAVQEVGDIPLTLLVVPWFHRTAGLERAPTFDRALSDLRRRGHELALHGYDHLDPTTPSGAADWFRRRVYTAGEGEFAALDSAEAQRRLQAGRQWFQSRGWTTSGFVPPAWLMGAGARQAIQNDGKLDYVTTLRHFHLLRSGRSMRAPCLVWSVRSGWRRAMSLAWNPALEALSRESTLVRLALHPDDADHRSIRTSWQRALRRLLEVREAVTKTAFATAMNGTGSTKETIRRFV